MPKFRKKPVVIEAVQVTADWFDGEHPNPLHFTSDAIVTDPRRRCVFVQTVNGTARANEGDWICRQDTNGYPDYWPVESRIFAATYEPVDTPTDSESARARHAR